MSRPLSPGRGSRERRPNDPTPDGQALAIARQLVHRRFVTFAYDLLGHCFKQEYRNRAYAFLEPI